MDPKLATAWMFPPFSDGIETIWNSDCVTVLRQGDARANHQVALALQTGVKEWARGNGLRECDRATIAQRYSEAISREPHNGPGDTWGLVALLYLWDAQHQQGTSKRPSMLAALTLIAGTRAAAHGDQFLWKRTAAALMSNEARITKAMSGAVAARGLHVVHEQDRKAVYEYFDAHRDQFFNYQDAAEELSKRSWGSKSTDYKQRTLWNWIHDDDRTRSIRWKGRRRPRGA